MDDQTPEGNVAVADADETRSYTQKEIDALGAKGQAFKNPDGSYSYPVANVADLKNAIHAVGRGNADHNALRKYIMARAKALGSSNLIPDNWGADGSLSQANAADVELEQRKALAVQLSGPRMMERRSADTGPIEVRETNDGKLHIAGYASVFDRPYDMGMYSEIVKRGAFSKTLDGGAQVHLLQNHSGPPLASTLNDTLSLKEDGIGLRYEAELDPEDLESAAMVRRIRSGLMQESSFAFIPVRQAWSDDYSERTLTELNINKGDVSVVNFGASPHTSVQARGALEDFERRAVAFALEVVESEERAGAKFSAGNLATLKSVLALVARADTAVDQAQVSLSKLIGVTNPDIAQDAKLDREDYGSSAEQKAAEAESETREQDAAGEPEVEAEPDEPAAEERAATVTRLPLPDHTQSARAMLARVRRA